MKHKMLFALSFFFLIFIGFSTSTLSAGESHTFEWGSFKSYPALGEWTETLPDNHMEGFERIIYDNILTLENTPPSEPDINLHLYRLTSQWFEISSGYQYFMTFEDFSIDGFSAIPASYREDVAFKVRVQTNDVPPKTIHAFTINEDATDDITTVLNSFQNQTVRIIIDFLYWEDYFTQVNFSYLRFEENHEPSLSAGYDAGYQDAYDNYFQPRYDEGYQDGYDAGYDDGYDAGYLQGLEDAGVETTVYWSETLTGGGQAGGVKVSGSAMFTENDLATATIWVDGEMLVEEGEPVYPSTINYQLRSDYWEMIDSDGDTKSLYLYFSPGTMQGTIAASWGYDFPVNVEIEMTTDIANIEAMYQMAYDEGEQAGLEQCIDCDYGMGWIIAFFGLFQMIFGIQLLPGLTIGILVGIPVVFGVFFFFLKIVRG